LIPFRLRISPPFLCLANLSQLPPLGAWSRIQPSRPVRLYFFHARVAPLSPGCYCHETSYGTKTKAYPSVCLRLPFPSPVTYGTLYSLCCPRLFRHSPARFVRPFVEFCCGLPPVAFPASAGHLVPVLSLCVPFNVILDQLRILEIVVHSRFKFSCSRWPSDECRDPDWMCSCFCVCFPSIGSPLVF